MSFTDVKGWIAFGIDTLCFKDRALLSQCFRVIIRQGIHFIRLHHVKGTPETLTSLIPATKSLAIEYFIDTGDASSEVPVNETNGRFQGTLRPLSIESNGLAAIDSIARLPLKYEEVNLSSSLPFVQPYNQLLLTCTLALETTRHRYQKASLPLDKSRRCVGLPLHLCSHSWDRRLLGVDRRKLHQSPDGAFGNIQKTRLYAGKIHSVDQSLESTRTGFRVDSGQVYRRRHRNRDRYSRLGAHR